MSALAIVVCSTCIIAPLAVFAGGCGGGGASREATLTELFAALGREMVGMSRESDLDVFASRLDDIEDAIAIAEGVDFSVGQVVSLAPGGSTVYSGSKAIGFAVIGESELARESTRTIGETALNVATAPLGIVGTVINGVVDTRKAVDLGQNIAAELSD